jgi:hypothetical protein
MIPACKPCVKQGGNAMATKPAPTNDAQHQPAIAARPDANYGVWRLAQVPQLRMYYVESTASVNIETAYTPPAPHELPSVAEHAAKPVPLTDLAAATELAAFLAGSDNAEVVFQVNGFNTTRQESKASAESAYRAIHGDGALPGDRTIAFIGFRWPSERMLRPFPSSVTAASLSLWICAVAFVFIAAIGGLAARNPSIALPAWPWLPHGAMFWTWLQVGVVLGFVAMLLAMSRLLPLPALVGIPLVVAGWLALWVGAGYALRDDAGRGVIAWGVSIVWFAALLVSFTIPAGLIALRSVVYFRDAYRATHYAVPDLLEFIRKLDDALDQHYAERGIGPEQRPRANISFIAHSMGAFVVTNLVRVLTDVFRVNAAEGGEIRSASVPDNPGAGQRFTRVGSVIGKCLCLGRLLMISPDISAAALLTNRANFLHSALRRFGEIYLFSNEGDGVLRTTSTLANFFSFPTSRREHGYRLGNVEVLDAKGRFGIANPGRDLTVQEFFDTLRVGRRTLSELYGKTNPGKGRGLPPDHDDSFPSRFTYFDCTSYRDVRAGTPAGRERREVGLLTWPTRGETLRLPGHTALLVQYLVPTPWKIDIHGGYFHGEFSQRLIYRLACLGYAGLLGALGGDQDALHRECEKKQIRVLLAQDKDSRQMTPVARGPLRGLVDAQPGANGAAPAVGEAPETK